MVSKTNINNQNLDISLLESLSPEEKELALAILEEYSKEGTSEQLNKLLLEDFNEIPVDILTFVDNYEYLGNAWHDSEGKSKLYPYWREELVKIFPDNLTTSINNAILSGSRGRGKAQPLYSLVYTENGYRKMGDLKVGEKVYGDDGKLHPILGIFPQGKKPIYELTFTDGSKTRSSDEHLWTVRDNNDMKWKTITVKQMLSEPLYRKKSNQSIFEARYKLPLTKALVFNKRDTFISPYMMGCLIGDGCFSNSISLTTCDEEILNAFLYELDNNGYTIYKDRNSYLIKQKKKTMHNKYKDELVSLGLFKHRSWEKFIPDIYLHNDMESRLELLRGLLDTDGTITPESIISYTTTSETLAEQIVFLVQSLGGTAKTYYSEKATYKNKRGDILPCRDSFTVSIKLPSEIIPFKLSRKIARLNPRRIEPQRNLIAIEYIGEEECQCIYIDSESHLYLTDNLIVTHNTEIAVLIAAYLLHRVLCLKDPIAYFHLKPTEKLVFAFMNIKKDLAEEIGIAKFQNTIQSSPWFLKHGTIEGRTNKIWVPQKFNNQEAVDIKIGSQADDLIGLPIYFCLDGKTPILTETGVFNIEDLEGKKIKVPTLSDNNTVILSEECTVKQTAESKIEYEIELEDGSIIKCTHNHRFRLIDGRYKEAQYLTEQDEILAFVSLELCSDKHSLDLAEKKFIRLLSEEIRHKISEKNKRKNTPGEVKQKMCSSVIIKMKIKSIKINHFDTPKKYYDVVNADPFNNFFIKTETSFICSHNCFFDEVSFQRNQDIEKQKKKANDMIDTAIGGMKTRFVHRGKNPTLLVLASSKRSDKSFLEEHMRKKLVSEKDNVYISDGSVWEVKPPGTYSDTTFRVALGNKFLDSVVMRDDEDTEAYREKGYIDIINVPTDFKPDFLDDIDRALCDFAGISASSISKYINGAATVENVTDRIKNPFSREILEIGDGPDDVEVQYYNFFDIDKIDPALRYKPLFIHLDMSYSGDMTGIAGIFIRGKKHSQIDLDQSKDLFYSLAFSVSIKAPRGRHISFEKNRNFIYWLKSKGFNIRGITTDTYQSYDTGETLRSKGYPYSVLSVDRVDTNHVCLLGNTKVKTPKGSKEIKDLIPGEEIYSYDIENNCEVLTTFDSWEYTDDVEEYYEITTVDGSKINCTGNHLILTARGYIRADELSENDFIRQSTNAKLCVDSIEGDKVCV